MTHAAVVNHLRSTFQGGKTRPLAFRKQQLQQLQKLITENERELCDAVFRDIHRCKAEAICYETQFGENEINTALKGLDSWAKPQKVSKNLLQVMDDAMIMKDPLGVVLIIAPWNYPIQLVLVPLVAAIAAGNCVIIKPSELAPHTGEVWSALLPKYLDQDAYRVIMGGVAETTSLLVERFDHIFYTGSIAVGKIVMKAASEHLTPVTLELGGKCPVYVDESCDIAIAGKRIAWGKFLSAGQTCLAPDYLLCNEKIKDKLVQSIRDGVRKFYGTDAQKSKDYSRIISDRHFERLQPLLKSGRISFGGKTDRGDLYIEPTILEDVESGDAVMQQEIFGPLLPIITVRNVDEAVEFINEREKPLALYIFSNTQRDINKILSETSSGGVTINDCLLHVALDTLPFGGVGYSGMGRYHGKFGFDTFTHEKAVLARPESGEKILWMRYPPYDEGKLYWARLITKKRFLPELWILSYLPLFVVGLIFGYILQDFAISPTLDLKVLAVRCMAEKHAAYISNSATNVQQPYEDNRL